jgi:hypothetical protein
MTRGASFRRSMLAPALCALGIGACRSVEHPCASPKPAIRLKVGWPIAAKATAIYNRHGDDSLTTIAIASTGGGFVSMGTLPGVYDYRVITQGFADWVTTNALISADACGPMTMETEIFMQPPKSP